MIEHWHKKLLKLFALKQRRDGDAGMRWSLERLEDRNMLSASMGWMSSDAMAYGPRPFNRGNDDVGSHGDGNMKNGAPASFASIPQRTFSNDMHDSSPWRGFGNDYNGFQDRTQAWQDYQSRPYMRDSFGPHSWTSSYNVSGSSWRSWTRDVPEAVAAPDAPHAPPLMLEPINTSPSPPTAPSVKPPPAAADLSSYLPSAPVTTTITHITTVVVESIVPTITRPKPESHNELKLPFLGSLGLPELPIPSVTDVVALATTLTELPVTATEQLISHESSPVAVLAATARDIAIQAFAPNLLLITSPAMNDRAVTVAVKENAQAEPLDGFIPTIDSTIIDDMVRSSETVSQEREAMNAVMQSLREVDGPLVGAIPANETSLIGESTTGQDINFQIDLMQTETLADELPAGEVQGGMVLLHSGDDVGASRFDLTPVFAEHVQYAHAPATMETSVGLLQEVDVAVNDSPVAETARPSESKLQRQTQLPIEAPLDVQQRSVPTSRKSAALVGAATIASAMLWVNRRGSQSGLSDATAKKRQAFWPSLWRKIVIACS